MYCTCNSGVVFNFTIAIAINSNDQKRTLVLCLIKVSDASYV